MGDAFAGVENMIKETFLPRIFFGNMKTISPIVAALSTTPAKKYRLGPLNPVTSAKEKYLIPQWGSAELIRAVKGEGALSNVDHIRMLGEERCDERKYREAEYETKLKDLVRDLKGTDRRLILCAKSAGAWMSVHDTTVSGTVLSAMGIRYFLCAHYNVSPLNLQSHYDGSGKVFGVTHTLIYSTGVLVIVHQN